MNEPEEKKKEKFPRLNTSKSGLTGLLAGLMTRSAPEEAWRQQNRKRGGWGGRGFTKSITNKRKEKKRRIMARASRKNNQRKKHPSRISRTGRRK